MIDLFAAIVTRWKARGLPGQGPDVIKGGAQFTISNSEPLERTQRPYAILKSISEATVARSNVSEYEDQGFEVVITANTPDQGDALRKLVDKALRYAPLPLAEGKAMAILTKGLRHEDSDQLCQVFREYLGKVTVAVQHFPG